MVIRFSTLASEIDKRFGEYLSGQYGHQDA